MELTLPSLVDEFIAAKQIEGRSAKTLSWYRWLLGKFSASMTDNRLPNFTLASARDFVAGLQARTTRYEHHPISPEKQGGLSVSTISAYRKSCATTRLIA